MNTQYDIIRKLSVEEFSKIADRTNEDCIIRIFGDDEKADNCKESRIITVNSCSECFKNWLNKKINNG